MQGNNLIIYFLLCLFLLIVVSHHCCFSPLLFLPVVFFDHYLQQRRQRQPPPPRHDGTLGFGAGTEPIDVTVAADDSAGARMEEKKYQPFSSLVAVVVVAPVEPAMVVVVREIGLYDTCWWYSLCNF
jgi:hypothetical protein